MDFRLPESLIFLELCNPFSSSTPGSISEDSWSYISQLAQLHGGTPFLYYRTKTLGISLPPQVMEEWRRSYFVQIAKEVQARRQIKEISKIVSREHIPIILLKGPSAMLRLYPDPGLRTFCDLDMLIPEDKVSEFKQAMVSAGYKSLSTMNSLEDEELHQFDGVIAHFCKEQCLTIDPRMNIFGMRGRHLVALPEIWHEKETTNVDGITIDHLGKEHFILHTLLHREEHFSYNGFVEIKGFIDLLYAKKMWNIDWTRVRDIARKWNVEREILPIMATLNQYWQADIPLTGKALPLDLQTLMLGVEDQKKHYYAEIPGGYIKRLFKMKMLPDTSSRLRYLLHLFFPSRENLCCRYNLSSKRIVMPYYFLHLFVTCRKFLTGLWYQCLPGNDSVTQ